MLSSIGNVLSPGDAKAEQFSTDHLVHNIGQRARSGGVITITAQAAKFMLNFGTAVVLARLLGPKDFGLVGMVLGVTALVGIFKELGLSTATVQRESITQAQVSVLFWINVVTSGTVALISAGLAPMIALFYRDSRITGIMLALSFTFLLTGSTVQHQALLARRMSFRALAAIDVSSITIGAMIACFLAWQGFGYWALVAQQLAYAAAVLLMTWWISRWRPSLPSRNSGVRPMLSFGLNLTLADAIARVTGNADNILIGRFFGAESLGLYTRAGVLLARPLEQVVLPINSVMIPVLSRLQSDPARYRRVFMQVYGTLALIVLPFAAMCFALSEPIVLLVLGVKWRGAIPLFSAFAIVAISTPLSAIVSWLFESQGRGQEQLRNHTIAGGVTVLAYVVGLRWGTLGVVSTLAFASILVRLPVVYYLAGRRGPIATRDLWEGFVSHLPCFVAFYLPTAIAQRLVAHDPPIVQILVCGPIGLLMGWAIVFLFNRPRQSALYAWGMFRGALLSRGSTSGS